jgi:hypothetical protein
VQTVATELEKYRLDLLGVQEVIWDKGSNEGAEYILSSIEKKLKVINYEQDFCK